MNMNMNVWPSSSVIHSKIDKQDVDSSSSTVRTNYYACLRVEVQALKEPEQLSWHVRLGDVVAVSLKKQTPKQIQEWRPQEMHLQDDTWTPALVVGMTQTISRTSSVNTGGGGAGNSSYQIHVQMLKRAISLPKEVQNKHKLQQTYRKWSKNEQRSQLPYVVLATEEYQIMAPSQLLPVHITMLTKYDFREGLDSRKNMLRTDQIFNLRFHCPKRLSPSHLLSAEPDNGDGWAILTQQCSTQPPVTKVISVPEALKRAWIEWPRRRDPTNHSMLQDLIQGYKLAQEEKHKEWQQMQQKQREEETSQQQQQQQQDLEKEKENTTLLISQSKRKQASSTLPGSSSTRTKRVKFQGEERAAPVAPGKAPTKAAPVKATNKVPVKAKAPPKTKAKTTKATTVTRKTPSNGRVSRDTLSIATMNTESTATTVKMTGKGRPSTAAGDESDDDSDQNSLLSPQPLHKEITPLSKCLLKVKEKEYYHSVQLSVDHDVLSVEEYRPKVKTMTVSVGMMVAVAVEGAKPPEPPAHPHNPWYPFERDWGIAQVVGLYKITVGGDNNDDDKDDDGWKVSVRWLHRYSDLSITEQTEVTKCGVQQDQHSYILFEKKQVDEFPLASVMPARIVLTSLDVPNKPKHWKPQRPNKNKQGDGLPTLNFLCQHLLGNKRSPRPVLQEDWTDYSDKLLESSSSLTGPLQRGFHGRPKTKITSIYIKIATNGGCLTDNHGGEEQAMKENPRKKAKPSTKQLLKKTAMAPKVVSAWMGTREICALARCVYQQWKMKFFDAVQIEIPKNILEDTFFPTTKYSTVRVGDIVPVLPTPQGSKGKKRKKNTQIDCSPFLCLWDAAQVVSIYQTESKRWMMQIRWLYRFENLIEKQQKERGVSKLNQPHVVFETEHYEHIAAFRVLPGCLVLTSSVSDEPGHWNPVASAAGLPFIPLLCGHICLDEEIDVATDWTDYNVNISRKSFPPPFIRGLSLCPRNRENKDWIMMLSRIYKKSIKQRVVEDDEVDLSKWGSKRGSATMETGSLQFNPQNVKAKFGNILCSADTHGSDSREFSDSAQLSIASEYCVSPSSRLNLKSSKSSRWELRVGDVVCYADHQAKAQAEHVLLKNERHPWYPFLTPWSYGQVLSIYRDTDDDVVNTPMLEIRRFYRASDLPSDIEELVPPADDPEREQVFESEDIVDGLSVSNVLGPVDLFLGHHTQKCNESETISQLVPKTSVRCRYFYVSSVQRFQPLYCAGFAPTAWYHRLVERGCLHVSKLIKESEALRAALESRIFGTSMLDVRGLLATEANKMAVEKDAVFSKSEYADNQSSCRIYHLSASLPPSWDHYDLTDLLFHREDRGTRERWTVHIGDVVAVRTVSSETTSNEIDRGTMYPYVVPWVPCQILAVHSNGSAEKTDSPSGNSLLFEVRELSLVACPSSHLNIPELVRNDRADAKDIESGDLLGPLTLVSGHEKPHFDWAKLSCHLPFAPCIARHFNLSLPDLKRELSYSKHYIEDEVERLVLSISHLRQGSGRSKADDGDKITSAMTRKGAYNTDENAAWTAVAPFHVDLSSLRAFYSELQIIPPVSKYLCRITNSTPTKPWTVRVGDVVMVEEQSGERRFPMNVHWAVAQIVAIWKDSQSKEKLTTQGMKSRGTVGDEEDIKIEIRWFYRRSDIAGVSGKDSSSHLEEFFETDEVDLVTAAHLLAPAVLRGDPQATPSLEDGHAMPIQEFYCGRFWSISRKSLIPCGGLEGISKRGRLYSQYLTNEMISDSSRMASSTGEDKHKRGEGRIAWKESFERVIKKLTLKDASTEAYDHGAGLIGREKELDKLVSFLQSAICSEAVTGDVKTSIFLAGPPGVGKTACVRSAIARLRSQQAKGNVRKFKFIPLNGMEMRHPFEAYVRLWEALSGKKEIRSPERACTKLEEYFTSPRKTGKESEDESVSVVLLDEIDYLVTERQSVLYNFFDWPKRAAELAHGRRLVVIGISNTLNLAEQLLPSVQSRVGSERCCFQAYNLKDTIAILQSKIQIASPDRTVFEDDAIIFAAKKTAALCGDIRKAFQICRAAAELVMTGDGKALLTDSDGTAIGPIVRIGDVQKASRASFNMALLTAVSFSSPFQALLLVTLAALGRTTGRETGGFDIKEIMTKMEAIAGASGDLQYSPPPSFGETIDLLNQLGETNLVQLRTPKSSTSSFRSSTGGSGGAWPLVSLSIDENTILKAFRGKDSSHQKLAESNLATSR